MRKEKEKNLHARRRTELIFVCCLLAWPILHKIIFYFGINFRSFFLAFQKYNSTLGKYESYGFHNFVQVFNDLRKMSQLKTCLKNTVLMYLVSTFFGMPVGILSAYFIHKKVPGSGFFKVLFFLPSIVSSVVMVLMFQYFCEYAIPDMAFKLFDVKLGKMLRQESTAFPLMLVYNEWAGFSGAMILYLSAMSNISEGVEEAARIDGANIMQEFLYITFPSIFSTVSVFLITGVVGLFSGSGAVYVFYKESAPQFVQTVGYFLFTKVWGTKASYETYPYAATLGMYITIVAVPLTFLVKYLLEKFGPSEE